MARPNKLVILRAPSLWLTSRQLRITKQATLGLVPATANFSSILPYSPGLVQVNMMAPVADREDGQNEGCTCLYGNFNPTFCLNRDSLSIYKGKQEISDNILLQCCGSCTGGQIPCMVESYGAGGGNATADTPSETLVVYRQPAGCQGCGGGQGIQFSWDQNNCTAAMRGLATNLKAPVISYLPNDTARTENDCFQACEDTETCDIWGYCGQVDGCSDGEWAAGTCTLKVWGEDLGAPSTWGNFKQFSGAGGFTSGMRCGWKTDNQKEGCPPIAAGNNQSKR